MVAKLSTMQALGSSAPEFSLPDITNNDELVSLGQFSAKPVLLMFICNHCPYVIHLIQPLTQLANQAMQRGFAVMAISANDIESYPQDAPGPMRQFARDHAFEFPYCFDQTQVVAQAYQAACTPDFFVYDHNHKLAYRGQFDDSRPGNGKPATGNDLAQALDAVLSNQAVNEQQIPSMGCSIKWQAGNEPDYF